MPKFVEMDDKVTLFAQMEQESGPAILINKFNVAPEEAEEYSKSGRRTRLS